MIIYTLECFVAAATKKEHERGGVYIRQIICMFMVHFLGFAAICLETEDVSYIIFYGFQQILLFATIALFRVAYPEADKLVINNMCMLLTISFIMLTRISYQKSIRQFIIVAVGQVVISAVAAAAHVIILVFSKDLGSAVIFFAGYLIMVFIATKNYFYLFAGILGGAGASIVAYHMFSHVRTRVIAFLHPWSNINDSGYQITQSLFAIGTGGWFGLGIDQGDPTSIPYVEQDFIFSAISEEMGGIFAICLIMVCISCFLMFLNIAMQMKEQFYKLVALGLGTVYAFQVFLTIGGVTKFIPSTGVTLPLISYGGSSLLATMMLFAVIQGLYILREDEGEELEKRRNKKKRKQQKNDPSAKKKRRPAEEGEKRKKSDGRNDGQGTRRKYSEQDEFERRIEEQTENSLRW